jgi:hypothetical protein
VLINLRCSDEKMLALRKMHGPLTGRKFEPIIASQIYTDLDQNMKSGKRKNDDDEKR